MTSGVYQIKNTLNGKLYIGSAASIERRWAVHRCYLEKGTHHSIKLQRAYSKYGAKAFEYSVVDECCVEECVRREQQYIDDCRSAAEGYNIRPTAESNRGLKRSSESRAKMAKAWETRPPMSEETKQKIARSTTGRKHTAESIAKMSAIQKQKSAERAGKPRGPCSDATKAKISEANRRVNAAKKAALNADVYA